MSLFENEQYLYRDTFFVHFDASNRPSGEEIRNCIAEIDETCELKNLRETDDKFESVTVMSPHDSSAMDITFVKGDEVAEQIEELMGEFRTMTLSGDDMSKLKTLASCNARFDIFHFEKRSETGEDDMLDPGGLLLVMEKLASVCKGVGLDPQSRTLL